MINISKIKRIYVEISEKRLVTRTREPKKTKTQQREREREREWQCFWCLFAKSKLWNNSSHSLSLALLFLSIFILAPKFGVNDFISPLFLLFCYFCLVQDNARGNLVSYRLIMRNLMIDFWYHLI